MNIKNTGNSIKQRIGSLQASQKTESTTKAPVKTGLSKTSFEQRKAVFE